MGRNDHCWGDIAGTSSSDLSNVSGSKKALHTIGCDCCDWWWQRRKHWKEPTNWGMFRLEDITSIATYRTYVIGQHSSINCVRARVTLIVIMLGWRILHVVEIKTSPESGALYSMQDHNWSRASNNGSVLLEWTHNYTPKSNPNCLRDCRSRTLNCPMCHPFWVCSCWKGEHLHLSKTASPRLEPFYYGESTQSRQYEEVAVASVWSGPSHWNCPFPPRLKKAKDPINFHHHLAISTWTLKMRWRFQGRTRHKHCCMKNVRLLLLIFFRSSASKEKRGFQTYRFKPKL